MNASRSPSPAVAASETNTNGNSSPNTPNEKKLRVSQADRRNNDDSIASHTAISHCFPTSHRVVSDVPKSCPGSTSTAKLKREHVQQSTATTVPKHPPDTNDEEDKKPMAVPSVQLSMKPPPPSSLSNSMNSSLESVVARDRIRKRNRVKFENNDNSYQGRRAEKPRPTLEHSRAMSRLYSQRNRDKQKNIIDELTKTKSQLENEKEGLMHQRQQLESLLRAAQTEKEKLREQELAQRFASAPETHRRIVEAFLGEGMGDVPPESWSYGSSGLSNGHVRTAANVTDVNDMIAQRIITHQYEPSTSSLPMSSLLNTPLRQQHPSDSFLLGRQQHGISIPPMSQATSSQLSSLQNLQRLRLYHEWQIRQQQLQMRSAHRSFDVDLATAPNAPAAPKSNLQTASSKEKTDDTATRRKTTTAKKTK